MAQSNSLLTLLLVGVGGYLAYEYFFAPSATAAATPAPAAPAPPPASAVVTGTPGASAAPAATPVPAIHVPANVSLDLPLPPGVILPPNLVPQGISTSDEGAPSGGSSDPANISLSGLGCLDCGWGW